MELFYLFSHALPPPPNKISRPKIPLTTYGERDPPHGENGLYMERKDCAHIEKNTPIGETVSPPHEIFLFMLTPPPPPPGDRQS